MCKKLNRNGYFETDNMIGGSNYFILIDLVKAIINRSNTHFKEICIFTA